MSKHSTIVAVCLLFTILLARPAAAQEVEEGFRKDVQKLMDLTGAAAIGTQLATHVSNSMIDALKDAYPSIPDRAFTIVKEVIVEELGTMDDGPGGLMDELIAVYAKHFTHDDIRGLLAFYSTDLGKKVISTLPSVMQDSIAAGQRWSERQMPDVEQMIMTRLKAEGFIP